MSVSNILKDARNSIGEFCMNECHAYCCRKGTIPLTLNQIGLLKPTKLAQYSDRTSMILPCPQLIENKCQVYKSKGRPKVCREFPFVVRNEVIFVSKECHAVQEGKLYGYIAKLKQKGHEVIEE